MDELEKLYLEYYDIVYRYSLSLCKNEHEAKDISQETFLKAMKNIDSFNGKSKMSTWLCTIAKNIYLNSKRKKNNEIDYSIELLVSTDNIEKLILDKEKVKEIHQILHQLDDPYKEVFWMHLFGELSFKEIGELLNISDASARVIYHRAKLKIKEKLK